MTADSIAGFDEISNAQLKEMLINCLRGMKRKAHGAQEPRHIWKYVEVASTAQRGDSPARVINQRFLHGVDKPDADLFDLWSAGAWCRVSHAGTLRYEQKRRAK